MVNRSGGEDVYERPLSCRSPSELPSNHPPRQNGHVSPSGDATYQPQNRRVLRRHQQHLDEDDDDKHDGRKRMKAVRIKESPIMRRSYSPPHEHVRCSLTSRDGSKLSQFIADIDIFGIVSYRCFKYRFFDISMSYR